MTESNPVLRQLGFAASDRLLIIHADDIGMCQASVTAFRDLATGGTLTSASTMVPCPWFPAVAAACKDLPADRVDLGVHLTLTSEWDSYRWGPISAGSKDSSLTDEEGYFPRNGNSKTADDTSLFERFDIAEVETEISLQIERAFAAGIDVTHLDNHMGSLLFPRPMLEPYFKLAERHRLPVSFVRWNEKIVERFKERANLQPEQIEHLKRISDEFGERGYPMFDDLQVLRLRELENRLDKVRSIIDELKPGLSQLIIHPATDTPELRAMADTWRGRSSDCELFMSEEVARHIKKSGVHLIGYRALRDLLRKGSG